MSDAAWPRDASLASVLHAFRVKGLVQEQDKSSYFVEPEEQDPSSLRSSSEGGDVGGGGHEEWRCTDTQRYLVEKLGKTGWRLSTGHIEFLNVQFGRAVVTETLQGAALRPLPQYPLAYTRWMCANGQA